MTIDRAWLTDLQQRIELLRGFDDYLVVSVGVRGPNMDCAEGNAVATVSIGGDTATSEAFYLDDAIRLARGKIRREVEAREKARKKAKDDAAQAIEAGTAETGTGSVHESAVAASDAP